MQWEFVRIDIDFDEDEETPYFEVQQFSPEGAETREVPFMDYAEAVVELLADGWEPLGDDQFKRPYQS